LERLDGRGAARESGRGAMKILVRAPNWVGDAVMAVPAMETIRRAHANDEICVLARPVVADLFSGQPFADRILTYDFRGSHRGWLGREKLIAELRKEKFGVAVLLQNAFEAAWLAWRAGIPERIGYARDARGPLLTKAIRVPQEGEIPKHESDYYLELVRRAGWSEGSSAIPPVRLLVSDASRTAAESALRSAGARENSWRCAIAPGASYGAAKCWPPERFALLADRLISECGADVIFFGTPDEKEIAARIRSNMKSRAISLVGETSMRDLAALFVSCSAFIGNDSGAMHVAAAAGLPVIGIFGSTDPEGTAPVTEHFTLIREAASCSPCFLRRCPVDHRCMTRITVDSVLAAAMQFKSSPKNLFVRGAENV
jgi:heptosyltransferase-2